MKIIIVGCGRIGSRLASRFSDLGNEVVVIDEDPAMFQNLPDNFVGRKYEGNGLQEDVLVHADIESADALAAVTDSDVINAVIAWTALKRFNIERVVARSYDTRYDGVYELLGIRYISAVGWGTQRIEELLENDNFSSVFSAGNGQVEVYEMRVPQQLDDKRVADLPTLNEAMIISITRSGTAYFPTGDFVLKEGDLVHISATFEGIKAVEDLFLSGEAV